MTGSHRMSKKKMKNLLNQEKYHNLVLGLYYNVNVHYFDKVFMRKIVYLFIFLFTYSAYSQSLSVFNIDASQFPNVKANFYAFDSTGNQILNLSPSNFSIFENGISRKVTNISCPEPQPQKAISSVLVFDMSGSMHEEPPRIGSAKKAANAWVDGLPLGKSECALVSFSDNSYVVHDFTTNMQLLKNSIEQFVPTNGTNYNQALLDAPCGGLQVANLGKHKKVVVFLTDGQPNFPPDVSGIIDFALKNRITIYAVTLDMSAPQCIKEITKQTGGTYFENITTQNEAEATYIKLLGMAQGGEPCEIEWESKYSCQEGETDIKITQKPLNIFTNIKYPLPNITLAGLEISPRNLSFKNIKPGFKKDAVIKVTARNADYNFSNIVCTNSAFTIEPTNFQLSNGKSKDLVVSFAPTDSGFASAKFSFESNLCPVDYYVNGGFIGKKPKKPSLKVLTPNGNEKYIAGNDTLITWEGVADSDFVKLDYTIDNGATWNNITDTARGLKYIWENIPKPGSDLCKIRVKEQKVIQQIGKPGKLQYTFNHKLSVYSAEWSPDDSRIATASQDTTAIIWDAVTGKKLNVLTGHKAGVRVVRWSPEGSRLATLSDDETLIIWDAVTGVKQNLIKGYNNEMDDFAWSPDGSCISISSNNGSTVVWDAITGAQLKILVTTLNSNKQVSWSPDGSKIATTQNGNFVLIWDTKSWEIIDTLKNCVSDGTVSWCPDGKSIMSFRGDATIWDGNTGDFLYKIKNVNYAIWSPSGGQILVNGNTIYDVASRKITKMLGSPSGNEASTAWSPNCRLIASVNSNDESIWITNVETGESIYKFMGHKSEIYDINWSSDGSRIVSAGRDWSAKVWIADTVTYQLQEDQSDLFFSILVPKAIANDIDMKKCLLGSAKDSLLNCYIGNIGYCPVGIDSIYFSGGDANSFNVVSGVPKYSIDQGSSKTIEVRFIPNRIGIHDATINIITQSDTLVQNIQGEGVLPQIEVLSGFLDFGEVELGSEKIIKDTVLIKNISNNPITINDVVQLGPDKKQFEIINGGNSFVLQPNESRPLTIKFKPIYSGRTSGQLGFEYSGLGSPATVDIFGNGKGGLVYIMNDSSYAGEKRTIKLLMANIKPEGIASIATNFEAVIRLQNSILAPENRANTYMQKDSLYLNISGQIGTTVELAQIPVIAGLGSAEETSIDIIDFILKDNNGNKIDYNFEKASGVFKLLGICREGGTRLFNPTGKVEILSIMPNPASEDIEIKVNLIENGATIVSIFNSNGMKIKEYSIIGEIGQKTINLNAKDFSNGLYFIQLQTPTVLENQKLMIIK